MSQKNTYCRFNGAAWFDRQVQRRTREALNARGSKAGTRSREYKTEYARQLAMFRAERAEVKQRRQEKCLARMSKQSSSRISTT